MLERLIRSAYETGGEVAVHLRHVPNIRFKGRVQDIDRDSFALYHTGEASGWLWAFRFEELAACALIVGLPAEAIGPAQFSTPSPIADSHESP